MCDTGVILIHSVSLHGSLLTFLRSNSHTHHTLITVNRQYYIRHHHITRWSLKVSTSTIFANSSSSSTIYIKCMHRCGVLIARCRTWYRPPRAASPVCPSDPSRRSPWSSAPPELRPAAPLPRPCCHLGCHGTRSSLRHYGTRASLRRTIQTVHLARTYSNAPRGKVPAPQVRAVRRRLVRVGRTRGTAAALYGDLSTQAATLEHHESRGDLPRR